MMGIVKLTAKFVIVVLMLYFLAAILDGDFNKITNVAAVFSSLVQQIAALNQKTLVWVVVGGFLAYIVVKS